ncbi:MAG TPA: hypothetical protein PLC27_06135 [Saprospiraceae bacterium]|nr:hypothetical protein [Saprospiraceae bacterium]
MEKFIRYIVLFVFVFSNIGCYSQDISIDKLKTIPKTSLISIDVYRNTIECGLSFIYTAAHSKMILKSNGLQCLDFEEIPPPPNDLNVQENKKAKIECLSLQDGEVDRIEKLINGFDDDDFNTFNNPGKFDSGIGFKFTILFSNNELKEFSLINGATANQKELINYLFDLARLKSSMNREIIDDYMKHE